MNIKDAGVLYNKHSYKILATSYSWQDHLSELLVVMRQGHVTVLTSRT